MAKNAVADWSTTASANTDIAGIDIGEGCSPAGLNDAIRAEMAQSKTKFNTIDSAIATITASGIATVVKTTQAALYADLSASANAVGAVLQDSDPTKNDLYVKSGASGTGSWSAPLGIFAAAAQSYATSAAASATSAAASATSANSGAGDTRGLLAALPRGAVGVWPFDRLSAGSIPNIIDGNGNLAVTGSVTSGAFTGNGTITFTSSKSMDDWTMSCLIQVTGIATYNTILYDYTGNVDNFSNFSFHSVSGMGFTPGAPINPRTFDLFPVGNGVYQNQFGGFLNLVGKGWHVLTVRQDRTGLTYWLDGIKLYQAIGLVYSTLTFTKLRFGLAPDS